MRPHTALVKPFPQGREEFPPPASIEVLSVNSVPFSQPLQVDLDVLRAATAFHQMDVDATAGIVVVRQYGCCQREVSAW